MPRCLSSSPDSELPTALAAVLDAQGRRLIWVAERLGVDSSTVSRWRSGERPISEPRRLQLAAVLEVDPVDLLETAPDQRTGRERVRQR